MADIQTTVLKPALRKIGVKNPTTTELTDALASLNAMIASWGANDFLIFSVTRENFTLAINDAEYTIGSGGDFNTVRPVKITSAFLRDGSTDFKPLNISNIKRYNDIAEKTSNGRPCRLFYLPEYPLGKILFDLEPDKAYTLFIDSLKRISSFALITTAFALPEEYERAFVFNLAVDLSSEFNERLSPEVLAIAFDTKEEIMDLNASVRMAEPVDADNALLWRTLQ